MGHESYDFGYLVEQIDCFRITQEAVRKKWNK